MLGLETRDVAYAGAALALAVAQLANFGCCVPQEARVGFGVCHYG